jgi:hypothetical protein
MPKYQTPRVPIETPPFDENGKWSRTWVIFLERLAKLESRVATLEEQVAQLPPAGADYEEATWAIYDTTVGANASNLLSVRRAGTLVDAEIIPKTNTTAAFKFDILLTRAGDTFSSRASIFSGTTKLLVPSGTAQGTVISSNAFLTNPYPVNVDDVLSSDILAGGSADIYSVILKWKLSA